MWSTHKAPPNAVVTGSALYWAGDAIFGSSRRRYRVRPGSSGKVRRARRRPWVPAVVKRSLVARRLPTLSEVDCLTPELAMLQSTRQRQHFPVHSAMLLQSASSWE